MKKLTVLVFALAVSVFLVAPALEAHASGSKPPTTKPTPNTGYKFAKTKIV
jgi:hypothetical protein